ncbi:MAG: aminoacyltransferase, partial [Lachnospiraceae bacterium]|nr:aminoacyltransferase [Lachnospiraceae bacterium]
ASDMTAENRDCEDTGSPDRRPGSEREYPGRKALSAAFGQAFSEYCRGNNIVSEFIRFDPVTENALDFREVYGAEYNRHTLITDLRGDDPVAAEFTKSCRKNVRKAMRAGVSFETVTGPGDLKVFKDIYYDTMDRDRAADYYYFGDDYFSRLSGILGDELLMITAYFEGKAIASGIYFIDMDNMTLHVHLSGTLKEYLYLSPAYVLRYALALWGKENGFSMIHHGGGTSSSPEDPLFLFKKQFSGDRFLDFYIGRKIWNPEMYESLCERVGVPEGTGFFPAYRALESGRA